jgi:hypothetical protein
MTVAQGEVKQKNAGVTNMQAIERKAFKWRGMMTLLLALTLLVDAVSGIILYLTPFGRFANWTNWTLWGLSKGDWRAIHMVFSLLLILIIAGHLYFNWRVLIHFVWSKIQHGLNLKRELSVSIAIILAVFIGTLWHIQPFRALTDLREKAKYSWESGNIAAQRVQRVGYGRRVSANRSTSHLAPSSTFRGRDNARPGTTTHPAPSSTLRGRDYARLGTMDTLMGTLVQKDDEWGFKVGENVFDIHLGPSEYRTDRGFTLKNGEQATIKGFVYQNHVSVSSIETGGRSITLRDQSGRPAWAGQGRRAFGSAL